MKTSRKFRHGMFVIICLGLLVFSGCSSRLCVRKSSNSFHSSFCNRGYDSALRYREGSLPAYRIVIELRPLMERQRAAFLEGFRKAYDDENDGWKGREYSTILSQALEGGYYDEAVVQGRLYVNGKTTDARIQELISGSVGLSRSSGLGWKAGYIAGFAQEIALHRSGFIVNEDQFYSQGETKYNALRGPLGV